MKIYKVKNYDEMSETAAEILAAQIQSKPNSVLGLATGSTPIGLYSKLAELCAAGRVDFSAVTSINLDEYCALDPGDINSYRRFMNDNLFSKINIKAENTHVPDGVAEDIAAECARYDALIASNGIDIQLLGLGHNGHIGFNEPADEFVLPTHCVKLDDRTVEANARFFENEDEVPKHAITMGIGAIMKAKQVLLIVSGEDKREILQRTLYGSVTPKVPASILQLHNDVIVVSDVI